MQLVPTIEPEIVREQAVLNYTKAGFAVFPCYNSRKGPPRWQMTQYDQNTTFDSIKRPLVYGLNMNASPQYFVLDVDPRNYPQGHNHLTEFLSFLKMTADDIKTPVVRSGGGGFHIYFRRPSGFLLTNTVPNFNAIEIKAEGRYVVGLGSIHNKTGKSYDLLKGSFEQIQDAPLHLLEYCKYVEREPRQGISDDELDQPQTMEQFKRHLLNTSDLSSYNNACAGYSFGLTKPITREIMHKYLYPRWDTGTLAEMDERIDHAYDYARGEQGEWHPSSDFGGFDPSTIVLPAEALDEKPKKSKSKKDDQKDSEGFDKIKGTGQYRQTPANLHRFLNTEIIKGEPNPLYQLTRYNLFAKKIEFKRAAFWHRAPQKYWTDADSIQLRTHLSLKYGYHAASAKQVYEEIITTARLDSYHPLKEFFESLPHDDVERVDTLFIKYAGAEDNKYSREISKNFLLSCVYRAFEPGCRADSMVVMTGEQGEGKTSFCKILGGPWYGDIHINLNKREDTVQLLQKFWIIELAEMTSIRQADRDALKQFLSKTEDDARFAWGMTNDAYPRQCVFIGTSNDHQFLQDWTGGRRFWPIATGGFDLDALKKDMPLIWAEAYRRYQQREEYHITDPEILAMAKEEQAERLETDPWLEEIKELLTEDELFGRAKIEEPIKTKNIAVLLGVPIARQNSGTDRRIARLMRVLKYKLVKSNGLMIWRKEVEQTTV